MSEEITTINDRITILIDVFSNRNNSAFARLIDAKESSIRAYKRGCVPSYVFLEKIVRILNISGHWLLTGEGEMLNTVPKNDELIELRRKLIQYIDNEIADYKA